MGYEQQIDDLIRADVKRGCISQPCDREPTVAVTVVTNVNVETTDKRLGSTSFACDEHKGTVIDERTFHPVVTPLVSPSTTLVEQD